MVQSFADQLPSYSTCHWSRLLYYATAVERGQYLLNPQDNITQASGRFPPHLHYSNPNEDHGAIGCAPPSLMFPDQFAFHSTGSTEVAIITLLCTVTDLLRSNSYVVVISLDFSKAFNTVRHSTLLQKAAELDLPDHVYNWLVHFFEGHSHHTVYAGDTSSTKTITASIIRGSSIDPAAYVITLSDLKTLYPGSSIIKFADDTYLIIPASEVTTHSAEIL